MPRFDLVRVTDAPPLIRIDGSDAAPGRLPGRRLHRRHLIKYAAPLLSVEVNREHRGPGRPVPTGERLTVTAEDALTALVAERGDHRARLVLDPALRPPNAWTTPPGPSTGSGRWHVEVDGARLTGGTWSTTGTASGVRLLFDVDERWCPGPLPWLMRVVTTVVPVFRRWPTTYAWRCEVRLDGTEPTTSSRWRRTGPTAVDSYRRATGS
ncbi:hypothetical protein [Georgenia sp. H159]|uniref:hypothetical protein n=1 Tax=Georgenia sp. H159 TaxID=3076115 RepID=UPI002D792158|nr:hypothetical protein [Georgenia sp. H159]